jgi:hypothetical protein
MPLEAPEHVARIWDRDRLHQLFTNLLCKLIEDEWVVI